MIFIKISSAKKGHFYNICLTTRETLFLFDDYFLEEKDCSAFNKVVFMTILRCRFIEQKLTINKNHPNNNKKIFLISFNQNNFEEGTSGSVSFISAPDSSSAT